MTVSQVAFRDVFDGTTSFAPKAIVQLALPNIVSRQGFQVISGEDGLDSFSAVPLLLQRDGRKILKFVLWRHLGNPEGTFAIHFGLSDFQELGLLESVLHDLDIPNSAVVWREPDRAAPVTVGPTGDEASRASGEKADVLRTTRVSEEISLHQDDFLRLRIPGTATEQRTRDPGSDPGSPEIASTRGR